MLKLDKAAGSLQIKEEQNGSSSSNKRTEHMEITWLLEQMLHSD